MQTHKPANSDKPQKMAQPKTDERPFQFAIESVPGFVDSRTQAVQFASIQSTARQSPQQQKLLTLQAQMASAYSTPSSFQKSQSGLKGNQMLNNSASIIPVQRLAKKHGMSEANLKKAAGYSVYGWGRLIANDGTFVDLTPSKAENGEHAEDYLMKEAYGILELDPYGYSALQIWVTSSPCSTTFGTSEKDEGCHEELNEMPEQYPISLDVFATKAYQPKGVIGGKKASVDAMTSDSNINYAVDNKRGVAKTLELQKYTVPADLAPLGNTVIQLANQANSESTSEVAKSNNTGLPNNLKSGIENLSGYAMDDVKVHYNSDKPAQLNAHAYAQGTHIHLAPGQEQHLPHEAWHVVQQKQGRVKPTVQMKAGVPVNDDAGLENEADVMGAKALSISVAIPGQEQARDNVPAFTSSTAQLVVKASKVVSALQTILKLHGLEAIYNTWWANKTIKRISEEIGGKAETDETNLSSLVRGHAEVADLLKEYRKDMPVGAVADGSAGGVAAENAEVINAFRSMVFYHGSRFAASIRENGLDPARGGSEEGASATRSINASAKEKNIAGAKGFVFVTRSFDEAKQYADGSSGVVYLIVPPELKNNLVLDVDSQLGMKGKDHLKGAVNGDKTLNWWGMQYLVTYLANKYTKDELTIIWARVKDECVK